MCWSARRRWRRIVKAAKRRDGRVGEGTATFGNSFSVGSGDPAAVCGGRLTFNGAEELQAFPAGIRRALRDGREVYPRAPPSQDFIGNSYRFLSNNNSYLTNKI